MKILFFNLNYARNDFNGILDFIKNDFDVLCFQEINGEIKREIDNILVDYECGFISKELGEFGSFNIATYINKKFNNFSFEILEDNLSETTPAVFLEVEDGNSKYNILNFHGQPKPGTKLDTKEREEASKRIIDFIKEKSGEKIIGGDFNLLPNTQSILAFENSGYKNLIKEFNIKTTRNNNAWKHYEDKQLFADYVFVSKNLKIKKFEVIENEISDHLPIILEI
jgi:endonuclease/exonuclease/phosphatase family metal-dependent hydrolase